MEREGVKSIEGKEIVILSNESFVAEILLEEKEIRLRPSWDSALRCEISFRTDELPLLEEIIRAVREEVRG